MYGKLSFLYLHSGVRYREQAWLDAVLVVSHGGLLGPRRHIGRTVEDDGGEGAGDAGLQRHAPLAEQAGVGAVVAREAEQHVEELEVRGQGELDGLEVHQLHDGSEVVVRLRPSLAVGQHQDPVDTGVELALLLALAGVLGRGEPDQILD